MVIWSRQLVLAQSIGFVQGRYGISGVLGAFGAAANVPVTSGAIMSAESAARMYATGQYTMEDIGHRFGVTRACVSLWMKRYPREFEQGQERRQSFRVVRDAKVLEQAYADNAWWDADERCRVCDATLWPRRAGNARVCSEQCSADWQTAKRYLDPDLYDNHRRNVARYTLERGFADPMGTYRALAAGDGPEPNRYFLKPGSRTHQVLRRLWRDYPHLRERLEPWRDYLET